MKILVTGGLGFIGTHLVRTLQAAGHDVFTLDRLHGPSPKHIRADMRAFRVLDEALSTHRFALVYHLAAEPGRWNGEAHYEALWETNVIGSRNLLELQVKYGFKLVFLSSSEVYGDFEGVMSEDVPERQPIRLLNDYAITKWVVEQQIHNFSERFGTETVRIRLFNVYGPGEPWGANRGVVVRFIHHALHDLPFTVHRGHLRTSSYVTDVARTLASVASHFHAGAVYNVGGLELHDMETLAERVLFETGRPSTLIRFADAEPFTTREKRADLSRAVADLHHAPQIGLEEGIRHTVAWARSAWQRDDASDPVAESGRGSEGPDPRLHL